jgi:hypothetical protein
MKVARRTPGPTAEFSQISICEIFGVIRFSTFSTESAQSGRSSVRRMG